MSRFGNLADKAKQLKNSGDGAVSPLQSENVVGASGSPLPATPSSRIGRKAISAYFSPEMSRAMHICARMHGMSLQALMAEAFDDVLRKYGESSIGG